MSITARNALTIAIAMFACGSALAESESSDMQVSAEVVSNCTISTTDMNFGAYDPIGANAEEPLNSSGEVTIQCTLGSEVTVTLDYGQHAELLGEGRGDGAIRKLASAGSSMQYELYGDAAHKDAWGVSAISSFSMVGTGNEQTLTVHGTIPAGQNLEVGSYSDVVTATVEFF
jgi:spore coat protein U-like protein